MRSFSEYVRGILDQDPDDRAIVESSVGRWYSRKHVKDAAVSIADILTHQGLQRGDIVSCSCEDSVAFACAILGIGFAGGAFSVCYADQSKAEWMDEVTLCQSRFLLTDAGPRLLTAVQIAAEVPSVRAIFALVKPNSKDSQIGTATANIPIHLVDIDACEAAPPADGYGIRGAPGALHTSPGQELASIWFTSGSTGKPKAAMYSQAGVYAEVTSVRRRMMELSYDCESKAHVELGILGLCGAPGVYQLFDAIVAGHAIVLADVCGYETLRSDMDALVNVIREYSCTHTWWMPTDISRFVSYCSRQMMQQNRLDAIVWLGSVLPQSVAQPFITATAGQTRLFPMYASTELGAITMGPPLDLSNCCHTGSLIVRDSIRLIDEETGAIVLPVDKRQQGEIIARFLPQTMMGYIKREMGDEVIEHEGHKWWKTGDIGSMDKDGLLYIVGRKKDMIKPYGIPVSASLLESLLLGHEDVAEAVVIAIPDQDLVEVPKAFVVLKPGSQITAEQLNTYFDERATNCQRLRGGIEILDHLPTVSFGKVDKQRLRQISAQQMISSHRKT